MVAEKGAIYKGGSPGNCFMVEIEGDLRASHGGTEGTKDTEEEESKNRNRVDSVAFCAIFGVYMN